MHVCYLWCTRENFNILNFPCLLIVLEWQPEGLEDCKISDYFDFMFTTLPHKLLQPEQFEIETQNLRSR